MRFFSSQKYEQNNRNFRGAEKSGEHEYWQIVSLGDNREGVSMDAQGLGGHCERLAVFHANANQLLTRIIDSL